MIRLATINEINEIMEITKEAVASLKKDGVNQWQNGYPNREIFMNDIKNGTLYICIRDGVNGVCNLSLEKDPSYKVIHDGRWLTVDEKYLVIHRIAINPKMARSGLASEMFQYAIDYARISGAKSIRIDTHIDNFRMKNLLKKLNFIECGKIYLVNNDGDNMRIAYELLV